ncbi:hypothetical protein AB0F46_39060 [Streptomyces sp. NPDC026665]|uniref:hypothetical protein n=1 Tax=Streptomyces sp. NPDC026665 TaxID=3154798 RepID=UPI0033F9DF40
MREAMSDAELAEAQRRIMRLPKGPWPVEPNEYGLPDQVGPIAFLQTWNTDEQLPVVEFIGWARDAVPAFVGEVSRQRDRIRSLERQLAALRPEEAGASRG